ncbi:TonB-dependent receptor [Mucilaginibacter yixingensis]|nr:TonB-dependent receptor [Mucilaginibacter yixingensis]
MAKHTFLVLLCTFLFLGLANAQERKITGKVTDANKGEPIPGATVSVKGKKQKVATDVNGNYTISADPAKDVLVVSFIGYKEQSLPIGGKSAVNVTILEDTQGLNEVVVVGYGTVKKRDLTGSVVSVRAADITANPVTNVMESLQGKIPGMDINRTSGAVGTNPQVLLRGDRSIYGDNSPLYIVDGIQSSYDQINPSDIASIDVLKDASSTAIYGSAGSNGVVIITTKKGKVDQSSVNVDSYYGFSGDPHFLHSMTGDEYIQYQKERYRTANGVYPTDLSQLFTNANILAAVQQNKWIDWIDEIVNKSATQQKYNISFSTGVKKTQIYTSFTYSKESGLLTNENQTRGGIRLNLDHQLTSWATIGTNINVNYTVKNARYNNIFTKSLDALPLGDARDANGNINVTYIDGHTTPLGDEIPNQSVDNTRSPYGILNGYLQLTPIAGLTIRSNIGLSFNDSRQGKYIGKLSPDGIPNTYATPLATINNYFGYGYTWENTVTYNKTIAKNHNITLTGITSWADNRNDQNNELAQGQDLDSYLFYNLANGTQKVGLGSSYTQTNRLSFAGRLNYSFMGKYLLSFTNRWDGVSPLAEGHKWAMFPAGSAAWRVSDEAFMYKVKDVVNELKLRVGYGVTGNSGGIGAYSSQTQAITYQAISLNGALVPNLQYVGYFSNPNISWEKSYNLNLGADMSFLKNRIDLSVDYYNTETKGLLFKRTLPVTAAITAWASPMQTWQNIGETNNKGIEIALTTRNFANRKFTWTTNFAFTKNNEKIVYLPDGDLVSEKLFQGHPVSSFYDYKYLGIWSTADATEAAKYGAQPGYVKVATNPKIINGVSDDGVHPYTSTDMQILGSAVPKWLLGINNTFTYQNFDFNVFTMIRWGSMIQSKLIGWYDTGDNGQPKGIDYWTPENQGAYFPRPGIASTTGIASLQYLDGSYLKIKTITLGYKLPQSLLNKLTMKQMRIYATAYNPLVFTKEKALRGTDPETNGSDIFPLYASFVVGLNVTF